MQGWVSSESSMASWCDLGSCEPGAKAANSKERMIWPEGRSLDFLTELECVEIYCAQLIMETIYDPLDSPKVGIGRNHGLVCFNPPTPV